MFRMFNWSVTNFPYFFIKHFFQILSLLNNNFAIFICFSHKIRVTFARLYARFNILDS